MWIVRCLQRKNCIRRITEISVLSIESNLILMLISLFVFLCCLLFVTSLTPWYLVNSSVQPQNKIMKQLTNVFARIFLAHWMSKNVFVFSIRSFTTDLNAQNFAFNTINFLSNFKMLIFSHHHQQLYYAFTRCSWLCFDLKSIFTPIGHFYINKILNYITDHHKLPGIVVFILHSIYVSFSLSLPLRLHFEWYLKSQFIIKPRLQQYKLYFKPCEHLWLEINEEENENETVRKPTIISICRWLFVLCELFTSIVWCAVYGLIEIKSIIYVLGICREMSNSRKKTYSHSIRNSTLRVQPMWNYEAMHMHYITVVFDQYYISNVYWIQFQ